MAYANQNNDAKKSTNTRSMTLVNTKGTLTPVMLMTSFWDDMMKLVFYPELPEGQRSENRRFDRDNGVITCISRDKCNELANLYEELIKPRINDTESPKENFSVSVPIAGVNQLAIGLKVGEDGEYHAYVGLIKDINPETLTSDTIIEFELPRGEYITNYDPANGTFGERKITFNGLDVFCKDLSDFRSASSKAYVHAARCVDKTYKDMVYNAVVAIGTKVGANMSQVGGVGNSRYGRPSGSIFDQNTSGAPSNIPTMSLDELENDLAAAAGTLVN